jgi:hypothetical protein
MTGFVIEMKHKADGSKSFAGAVEVQSPDDVQTFEIRLFGSIAEASEHPFVSAEAAADAMLNTFPETTNLDYSVVAALNPARPQVH